MRSGGYVFVDAGLPMPGQAWMETVPPDLAAQVREMANARGWLPPWPQWWGDEALAELIPGPEARQRFAAGCPRLPLAMFEEIHPAGASVARCPRCLPPAERGIPGPGGQGTGTWLAGDRTAEPPPRAADRARPGRRIAARTNRSASLIAARWARRNAEIVPGPAQRAGLMTIRLSWSWWLVPRLPC
jgi:hypothetical protein